MAPHDTNTPRQARRHAVPLIGMAALVAVVIGGFFWWVREETEGSPPSARPSVEQPAEQIVEPPLVTPQQ